MKIVEQEPTPDPLQTLVHMKLFVGFQLKHVWTLTFLTVTDLKTAMSEADIGSYVSERSSPHSGPGQKGRWKVTYLGRWYNLMFQRCWNHWSVSDVLYALIHARLYAFYVFVYMGVFLCLKIWYKLISFLELWDIPPLRLGHNRGKQSEGGDELPSRRSQKGPGPKSSSCFEDHPT